MVKYIWFNLNFGINRSDFQEKFGEDLIQIFSLEFQFLESSDIVEIHDNRIVSKVSDFKLYLYLTIFLMRFISEDTVI